MSNELLGVYAIDQLVDCSEEERYRASLWAVGQAESLEEARDFLDALGLIPRGCYVGHGQRRPWCKHCRKKWPMNEFPDNARSQG